MALGARRLSIVDVAGGHQPVRNEQGSVWAARTGSCTTISSCDRSWRRTGIGSRSRCDTEILPHLYEREGERFPERLAGQVRDRGLGRERRRGGARPRPARGEAALLGPARRPRPLRLRAEERARERADRARARLRGDRRLPQLRLSPRPAHPPRRRAQAAPRPPAHRSTPTAPAARPTGTTPSPPPTTASASRSTPSGCSSCSRNRFGCA